MTAAVEKQIQAPVFGDNDVVKPPTILKKDVVLYDGSEPDGYVPTNLEVDDEDNDTDNPNIIPLKDPSKSTEAIEENGRTYHKYKQGNYYFPNDESEQKRLDLQHHLYKLTMNGKLNLAPVSNPESVLDIGTGTGIWAIEYASENPKTKVLGTDLSAIQRTSAVPSNCKFSIFDAEDDWTYPGRFTYIHGRALFSCWKSHPAIFQKVYDALTPGGWFEMQEIYFKPHSDDGTLSGTAFEEWNQKLVGGARMQGYDWWCTPKYKAWFEEVGLVNVVERRYQWPTNTWPKGDRNKQLGIWTLTNALSGLNAASMAIMTRVLGMSKEDVEAMLVDVRRDLRDKKVHAYYPMYVVYGQKPL